MVGRIKLDSMIKVSTGCGHSELLRNLTWVSHLIILNFSFLIWCLGIIIYILWSLRWNVAKSFERSLHISVIVPGHVHMVAPSMEGCQWQALRVTVVRHSRLHCMCGGRSRACSAGGVKGKKVEELAFYCRTSSYARITLQRAWGQNHV